MTHLQAVAVNSNLAVIAHDGSLTVMYVSDDGRETAFDSVSLPPVGETPRQSDGIIALGNNVVAVIGSNQVIAGHVEWSNNKASITFGAGVAFDEGLSAQPTFDTLNSTCFAISYFHVMSVQNTITISTRTGCVDINSSNPTVTLFTPNHYSDNHIFHGIAGRRMRVT